MSDDRKKEMKLDDIFKTVDDYELDGGERLSAIWSHFSDLNQDDKERIYLALIVYKLIEPALSLFRRKPTEGEK